MVYTKLSPVQKILITATGTGIGKTFVTAALCRQLRQNGVSFSAIKPVITGNLSDTEILLKASGLPITPETISNCSPWRFKAPLSIDMAAKKEGREVNFGELVTFCNQPSTGIKLIEGAGGIMSPINGKNTFLNLTYALACPIILVTGTYLGAISHTLTALEVLKGMEVKLIINESKNSEVDLQETASSIRQHINMEIITLRRNPSEDEIKQTLSLLQQKNIKIQTTSPA